MWWDSHLPQFCKEGSGTPVFKILVRALRGPDKLQQVKLYLSNLTFHPPFLETYQNTVFFRQRFLNPYSAIFYFFCPENVVCLLHLLHIFCIQVHFSPDLIIEAITMNPDQTAPKGSSLIWVNIGCNKGNLSISADKRADNKSCDWREKE